MKKISAVFLAFFAISGAVSIYADGNFLVGSRTISLRAEKSVYMKIEMEKVSVTTITAKADQGRVGIIVYDSRGRKVMSGVGKVTIKSGDKRERFKVRFTNKSKKLQKVEVSWIDVLMTDWG